jgi:hypothetical protein
MVSREVLSVCAGVPKRGLLRTKLKPDWSMSCPHHRPTFSLSSVECMFSMPPFPGTRYQFKDLGVLTRIRSSDANRCCLLSVGSGHYRRAALRR